MLTQVLSISMTYFLLYDGNIEMKQTWSPQPQLKIVKMLQNDLTLAKTLWLLRGQELAGFTPNFNIWWDPFQIAGNVLWHQYDTKRSYNIATNNFDICHCYQPHQWQSLCLCVGLNWLDTKLGLGCGGYVHTVLQAARRIKCSRVVWDKKRPYIQY